MPKPKTLISIRIHPGILKLADQFAALTAAREPAPFLDDSPAQWTRSDVIREAIALGLPILINPTQHPSKRNRLCPNGTINRRKTANERPSD